VRSLLNINYNTRLGIHSFPFSRSRSEWEKVARGRMRALALSAFQHLLRFLHRRALIRPVGHLLPSSGREKGDSLHRRRLSP
jgi:hypothetical protein